MPSVLLTLRSLHLLIKKSQAGHSTGPPDLETTLDLKTVSHKTGSNMKPITLLIFLWLTIFCFSCRSSVQTGVPAPISKPVDVEGTVDVRLCDILEEPEKYERKLVRVKGVFCDCFESATIYSSGCSDKKKIWVQGELGTCKNADRIDKFRSTSKNDAERMWGSWNFAVVAEGRLTGLKGGYGHMNAYDYLFEIDCFRHAELLDSHGYSPSTMPEAERHRLDDFEK